MLLLLLRKFFWIAVGIVAALQLDRWLSRQRMRMSPRAITGSLLDKANEGLEGRRATPERAPNP
jgi:hypothetical protein